MIVAFAILVISIFVVTVLYFIDRHFGTSFVHDFPAEEIPKSFSWHRSVTVFYDEGEARVFEFWATDNYEYYSHTRQWFNKSFSEDVMDHAYDFVRKIVVSGCSGKNGNWILPSQITGIEVSEVTKTPI